MNYDCGCGGNTTQDIISCNEDLSLFGVIKGDLLSTVLTKIKDFIVNCLKTNSQFTIIPITDVTTIQTPILGYLVIDSNDDILKYFNGTQWISLVFDSNQS